MEVIKYSKLIRGLKEKSRLGKALWQKTSRDDEFILHLDSGTVSTDLWDNNGNKTVDFVIRNDRGDVVGNIEYNNFEGAYYEELLELHSLARDSYYRTDETIKSMLDELDNKDKIGDIPF